ncbi:glycosyltransferase family 4 protein [Algoriphagus aquimarinus]|uniref:Glycosyltransferase involved in cell wall bisynthesis n=1 Tax=Algoriphagus aquimarinus TaxID=237018 RepID=A0A1I1A238_9BACT|nr:glycosyltransferase family 4 protein [Algoriphagus aquimarinus]SFB30463.1 Glycosyltransferase involved in cell wall bisynthesis [Algoriphagus aquimarinus]
MDDFLIITCVHHTSENGDYYAYGPYVREMNLWIEKENSVSVVAPLMSETKPGKIDLKYKHKQLRFVTVPAYHVQSVQAIFKTIFDLPGIIFQIAKAMRNAKHIHIRIPGNMGLLAMFVQIFFPSKPKTIKYAGNWDGLSQQPRTYKIQRFIANSPFLTKNAKVLVYGDWPDSSTNVLPFFTASYTDSEKEPVSKSPVSQKIKLVFVGALYDGKNPEIGLQLSNLMKQAGLNFEFVYCGDGVMRQELEAQSLALGLQDNVIFKGNVDADTVKQILQESHFLIFVSKTEGWPKAVAEAMFWGCIPFTSRVSCVPQMIGENREKGVLVSKDPQQIFEQLVTLLEDTKEFERMGKAAMDWARNYTLETFQSEIERLK